LANGLLVTVPSSLIKRVKNHFHTFTFGVSLILGCNGNIWVTEPFKEEKISNINIEEEMEEAPKTEITIVSTTPILITLRLLLIFVKKLVE
jgi:exosome complex RNA-binding protein Rrp4